MRELVIGNGQIGQAVKSAICDDLDTQVLDRGKQSVILPIDIMHVCFPYSETFVKDLQWYIKSYSPKHIVIYSTVPIGTTKQIPKAVHSPIEGKHPDLDDSIELMRRFVGFNDVAEGEFFYRFFKRRLLTKPKLINSTDHTEALKLLSTTEYGVNIEFARYKKYIADSLGMDYELTKEWNTAYNDLYEDLGLPQYKKFILDAPEGPKGGHCVTPNARLLDEQYPSELTRLVGEL